MDRPKRIAAQKQEKHGKKAKVENGGESEVDAASNAGMKEKCVSLEISHSTDKERSDAVKKICHAFAISQANAEAVVELAKGLQPEDPAILISFNSGQEIRSALQSTLAGHAAATNRPCLPGRNGNEALQNLKNWVISLLPGTNETRVETTDRGLAIGSLTHREYNSLTMTLSFTKPPAREWGIANAANNRSLGGLVGVTGTGIGSAAVAVLPSNGFCG